MTETVGKSSGSVFVDLGYSPDEAAIVQMRADLMMDLRKFIKAKRLTQAKAAELFGVSQSRVSDLTARGKWERFSLERLITLAMRTGMHVILKKAGDKDGSPDSSKILVIFRLFLTPISRPGNIFSK